MSAQEEVMAEKEYPSGAPSEDWTHDELDAWAEAEGYGPLEGTKPEKLKQIDMVLGLAERARKLTDRWADPALTIPVGATGPTVAHYRERLGLNDGGDQYDARMRGRVRETQRNASLPETGRLDPATRSVLG